MSGRTGITSGIRQWMKKRLTESLQRQYFRKIEERTVTYDVWIRQLEEGLKKRLELEEEGLGCPLSVKALPYEVCADYLRGRALEQETAEAVIFADSEGSLSSFAVPLVADFFERNEAVDLVYGDEDVLSPEGIRYTPWLKPHWSPDTFLSYFYFGSVFAVRTKALRSLSGQEKEWIGEQEDCRAVVRRLCAVLAVKCGGFAKREGEEAFPVGHVDEILFHADRNNEMGLEEDALSEEELEYILPCHKAGSPHAGANGAGTLSVIIPSRDNPKLLKRCIGSLEKAGEGRNGPVCEVIVVDNGSREETRLELESWLTERGMRYLYRPMDFHFSRMCNLGAEAASGEVLLFLNDDVEVPASACLGEESFPELLYREASAPYTGAVGVKLYYPDSIRIQHAGIVNLRLGPVHKLQFQEDQGSFYYGWNRKRRNVIAVTGACLTVRKDRFLEAGGFPEELPVAFNDVDLCFCLFEKGYYNVVLQETALFHHESLSRGRDEDREKLNRLLRERDLLYERHPGLYGRDPFYHRYLESDILSTGFQLCADYAWKGEEKPGRVRKAGGLLEGAREDRCVIVSLEYVGKDTGAGEYLIRGYAFVAGSDNACFERQILLRREEAEGGRHSTGDSLLAVLSEDMPRRDVEGNLPDQVNVGLTGFCVRIAGEELDRGCYRIGVLARDRSSGLKLYVWTERVLEAEGRDSGETGKGG
ncbi:MAG: glycosyltransferase [Kineothrix sp.]